MVRRSRNGLKQTSVRQDRRTADDRGGKRVANWRLRQQHRRDSQQILCSRKFYVNQVGQGDLRASLASVGMSGCLLALTKLAELQADTA